MVWLLFVVVCASFQFCDPLFLLFGCSVMAVGGVEWWWVVCGGGVEWGAVAAVVCVSFAPTGSVRSCLTALTNSVPFWSLPEDRELKCRLHGFESLKKLCLRYASQNGQKTRQDNAHAVVKLHSITQVVRERL